MEVRKCLLLNKIISEEECFDINMVVDDLAPINTISSEIINIKNYKNICLKCPYHNIDK